MYNVLMYLIIGFFASLLFLNIYFRLKVFKHYKYLVQNRVEFEVKDIFDKEKMAKEVLPKYPQHAHVINAFTSNIKNSVLIAAGILILISVLGYVISHFS